LSAWPKRRPRPSRPPGSPHRRDSTCRGGRLHAELSGRADEERAEVLERRAGRFTGVLLLGLAVYIIIDAGRRLLGYGVEARKSILGIVVTAISLIVMPRLGRAKLRTSAVLGSGALRADAYETIACTARKEAPEG
jgi:hypothetical protein